MVKHFKEYSPRTSTQTTAIATKKRNIRSFLKFCIIDDHIFLARWFCKLCYPGVLWLIFISLIFTYYTYISDLSSAMLFGVYNSLTPCDLALWYINAHIWLQIWAYGYLHRLIHFISYNRLDTDWLSLEIVQAFYFSGTPIWLSKLLKCRSLRH